MKKIKKFTKLLGTGNAFRLRYQFRDFKPSSIRIDITAVCNAKCPFCPRIYMPEDRKKGFMEFEYYKDLLQQAKRIGVEKLKLYITSEPTLHPDFERMVDLGKTMGFQIYISTNAMTLHKHIDTFHKIDVVQFSIEGWDKESYEKYRIPLKFDQVYANMEYYAEKSSDTGQLTSIHLPMTRQTNLEEFMLLWGQFVNQVSIDFMQPANIYSQGAMESGFSDVLTDDYYDFQLQDDSYVCFDPFEEITIGYDGKIHLCCLDFSGKYELGHADDGIGEVHMNDAIKKVRKQFYSQNMDTCSNCSLFYKPTSRSIEEVAGQIRSFRAKHDIGVEILFQGKSW